MDKNAPPDAAEVPLPDTDIDNPEKNRTGQKPEHKDFYVFKNASGDTLPAGSHNLNYEAGKKHLENNLKHVMALAKKDETTANERFFIEISTIIEKAEKVDAKSFVKKIKTITRQLNTSSDWEYSSERFNRRYFAEGIYSAGRRLKNEKIITVAVDVSASMVMRPESIETAFGAVEALLKDYRIYLVCIDETVFIPEKKEDAFIVSGKKTGNYLYKKGDWKYIRSGNCGTTFFAPLFNDYIRGHSEMLIVITDGEIYDMGTLVKYPKTLWLIPEGCGDDFSPPFGSFAPISNK
jgi:predicted metal-dependent peptidase